MSRSRFKQCIVMAALLAVVLAACHKEEQAVVGVAQKAANAGQKFEANQTQLDEERTELKEVPLPTKSLYIDIHDPSQWANPFLAIGPDVIMLRVLMADANPSTVGQGTLLRPVAARRQELQLRPADLDQAVAAIPAGAWPYGRVVAIAESSTVDPKDRPMARRNVEAAIKQLNDLGVVVEEWPAR